MEAADIGKVLAKPAWFPLALIGCWIACSSQASEGRALGPDDGSAPESPGNPGASGGTGGASPLPPEQENERGYGLPVVSGRWVWAANPESNRVALIDVRTLSVELAHAGFAPTYIAALPVDSEEASGAIVLNARSHDASLLFRTNSGVTSHNVPTHDGANAVRVSPSGRFAIVWTDASALEAADRAESFQDITVIDIPSAKATRLSVGYRPSRVFVQADEARAFVVCEPGISVVELEGEPAVSQEVVLAVEPNEQITDVAVVPAGTHAVARVAGDRAVRIADLETGTLTHVALSGPITDLDLVSDGSAAIAVVRGESSTTSEPDASGNAGAGGEGSGAGGAAGAAQEPLGEPGHSEIAILPIPAALDDPSSVLRVWTETRVGSVAVAESGDTAVLYSNATSLDRVLVLSTDPSSPRYLAPRAVGMRARVQSVFIAPDAQHAIVDLPPSGTSTRAGAFGIVPLESALPVKYQITDAPVTGVAFAPEPTRHAIVTAATGRTAYVVGMPSLLVERVALPNLPLAAGIVAEEGQAFVVQAHAEGQVSLIDLSTAAARTLTGFELAAEVLQ